MKKITVLFLVFIFVGQVLSAELSFGEIKKSAGFMALGDVSYGNGINSKATMRSTSYQIQNFNFGGGLFFDGTYFETFVGFTYGVLNNVKRDNNKQVAITSAQNTVHRESLGNALELNFGVLGKYPIGLGPITLFPILGLNYNIFLLAWDKKNVALTNSVPSTFSQFGFQAGAGVDYDFTSRVYFRLETLFQLRFVGSNLKEYGINNLKWYINSNKGNYSSFPGIGPVFKAGMGFRF